MNSANRPIRSTYEMSTSKSSDLTGILVDVAKLFGVWSFKDKQIEAFKAFVSGKDTFVSLPTGYGKSVIHAALPIIFDRLLTRKGSITVCISPLTSVRIDQSVCVRSAFIIAYHFRNTSGQNKNGIGN